MILSPLCFGNDLCTMYATEPQASRVSLLSKQWLMRSDRVIMHPVRRQISGNAKPASVTQSLAALPLKAGEGAPQGQVYVVTSSPTLHVLSSCLHH